ncbi:MAG: hypothetical protein PVI54_13675 [Desulfobacteraceae bacterium]
MKKFILIVITILLGGCVIFRQIPPYNDINIESIENVPLDIYDWKTIKFVHGQPDIVDTDSNIEFYIATYETRRSSKVTSSEIWYLVFHSQNKNGEESHAELFKESFSGELPEDQVRKNYNEIREFGKLINQRKIQQ